MTAPQTPEGLRAALALIDESTPDDALRVRLDAAVVAVARAQVEFDLTSEAIDRAPLGSDDLRTAIEANNVAYRARKSAVARLCALATGAQAGEGAGG